MITNVNLGEGPSITGTVFNDLNVNGKLDAVEPGLPGVTVFVNVDGSGKPDGTNPSTTTTPPTPILSMLCMPTSRSGPPMPPV